MTVDAGGAVAVSSEAMRRSSCLVALVVVMSGCFTELPDVPAGSGTDAGSSSGEVEATTMTPTTSTTMSLTMSDTTENIDMDPPGPETEGPAEPAGAFACPIEQPCEVWTLPDCAGACTLDAAGTCVLERMQGRETAALRVRRCDGPCTVDALVVRGSGGSEVVRQRASEGPDAVLTNLEPARQCELRPGEFFAACLADFTAECADPDAWTQGCAPRGPEICF